jgi:hypothetical protein
MEELELVSVDCGQAGAPSKISLIDIKLKVVTGELLIFTSTELVGLY